MMKTLVPALVYKQPWSYRRRFLEDDSGCRGSYVPTY